MKKHLPFLIALALTLGAHARLLRTWSYQELKDEATLIVVATPTKVSATSERAKLPNIVTVYNDGTKEDVIGAGVETTFEVLTVLKGEPSTKALVLHHFALPNGHVHANGPLLVSFDPKDKKRYLLFLLREADGRFAAVSGQTDPDIAIKELNGWPSK